MQKVYYTLGKVQRSTNDQDLSLNDIRTEIKGAADTLTVTSFGIGYMHMSVLLPDFFDRPATDIAQELLGKFMIREYNDHQWALMITEVEAYDGPDDKASNAHKGRTDHTEPMFADAGTLYVYPADEANWMINIVTGPREYPAAALIRSALVMLPTGEIEHIDDPAKLTKFLRIGKEFNGLKAAEQNSLWFEDRDITIPKEHIIRKKRIGADHAAEWKDALYNFSIEIVRHGGSS